MNKIEFGDCRDTMRRWASEGVRVQTCVTSPPYFGLRDYGHEGQIGLEQTPEQYIVAMVEVFRCVRDVLADDGTLWVNIGDSYFSTTKGSGGSGKSTLGPNRDLQNMNFRMSPVRLDAGQTGCKPKDLIGIPWMLAFALRADGWYLRQDIIWHKPNPMPESVRDRCTKAHEYIFLMSKSEKYFFDSEAMREPASNTSGWAKQINKGKTHKHKKPGWVYLDGREECHLGLKTWLNTETRNRRSVWTVNTKPYKGAHFAVFPPALIEPCILAGSRPGDIVLDPFIGSGTTAAVALQHGRRYLGCELNPEYGPLQDQRIAAATFQNSLF
jgi:DNA modification methylase